MSDQTIYLGEVDMLRSQVARLQTERDAALTAGQRERSRAETLAVELEGTRQALASALDDLERRDEISATDTLRQALATEPSERGGQILAVAAQMAEALEWVKGTHYPPSRQVTTATDAYRALGLPGGEEG